jgi:hypothetical protein
LWQGFGAHVWGRRTYTLKIMALVRVAPRKFEKMRFARGEVLRRRRGMMGRAAKDWV